MNRYLLAVNGTQSNIPDVWAEHLQSMQRPSSSTLEAFLIPSDDPRTRQVFNKVTAAAIAKRAKGIQGGSGARRLQKKRVG